MLNRARDDEMACNYLSRLRQNQEIQTRHLYIDYCSLSYVSINNKYSYSTSKIVIRWKLNKIYL